MLRAMVVLLSYVCVLLGCVILVGWVADIPVLYAPLSQGPLATFFAGVALILGGFIATRGVSIMQHERTEEMITHLMVASGLLLLIALPLVFAFFTRTQLGFEHVVGTHVVYGRTIEALIPSIGSIGALVALWAVASGTALLAPRPVLRAGGVLLVLIGSLALAGYVLRDPALYYFTARSNGMAVHEAAGWILLGLSLLVSSWMNGVSVPDREPAHAHSK